MNAVEHGQVNTLLNLISCTGGQQKGKVALLICDVQAWRNGQKQSNLGHVLYSVQLALKTTCWPADHLGKDNKVNTRLVTLHELAGKKHGKRYIQFRILNASHVKLGSDHENSPKKNKHNNKN